MFSTIFISNTADCESKIHGRDRSAWRMGLERRDHCWFGVFFINFAMALLSLQSLVVDYDANPLGVDFHGKTRAVAMKPTKPVAPCHVLNPENSSNLLGKKARNWGFLDIGVKGLYWVEIWWSCNCRWIKELIFILMQLCGSKWEAFSKSWWKCYFSARSRDEHWLEFQSPNLEAAFVENHVLPDAALLQETGTPFSVMPGGVSMGDGSCNSDSLVPASCSTGDLHPRCLGQG